MGNSAMRSCVQVQVSRQSAVRILQADGKELQFAHPVLAIQVMQEHPGHLVVKFNVSASTSTRSSSAASHQLQPNNSPLARQAGYAPAVTRSSPAVQRMLRADEALEPGNTYYLLRIPGQQHQHQQQDGPSGKKSMFKTLKPTSKVASSFEYEDRPDSRPDKKLHILRRSSSLPRFGSCKDVDQQQLTEPLPRRPLEGLPSHNSLGKLLMEGTGQKSCQLSLHQTMSLFEGRRSMKPPRSRSRARSQISWRPILESIREDDVTTEVVRLAAGADDCQPRIVAV